MKYFLDTEFIESAVGIELISIGIISEKGDTYYAESTSFDQRNADKWVEDNVLSKLRWWGNEESTKGFCNGSMKMNEDDRWECEVFGTDVFIERA